MVSLIIVCEVGLDVLAAMSQHTWKLLLLCLGTVASHHVVDFADLDTFPVRVLNVLRAGHSLPVFHLVFHPLLQHKGLLPEALQITYQVQLQETRGCAAHQDQVGLKYTGDVGVSRHSYMAQQGLLVLVQTLIILVQLLISWLPFWVGGL